MKKNTNRLMLAQCDRITALIYGVLLVLGLAIMGDINSARNSMNEFYKQIFFSFIALLAVLFIFKYIDFNKYRKKHIAMLLISGIMLIGVLIFGIVSNGGNRWFDLYIVRFQPSAVAKISLIFFYAYTLAKYQKDLPNYNLIEFIKKCALLIFVAGFIWMLIYAENHLSAIIISATTLGLMLFIAGTKLRVMGVFALVGVILFVWVIKFGEKFRSDRVLLYKKYCLFIKDDSIKGDIKGEGQALESLIALSKGGIFGIGSERGRAKHYFLPAALTDYVYSIIGEEFGFIGAMLIFIIHSFLFYRIVILALKQQDMYLRLLVIGLGLNIYLNVLINVGVSMCILLPTGTTLPFISYSGTALVTDSMCIGIILNITAKRKEL